MADLAIVFDPTKGTFDLAMDGPDLMMDDTLKTSLVISIFSNRRASADDVVPNDDPANPGAADRGGWWGDWFSPAMLDQQLAGGAVLPPKDRTGSLLWLLATAVSEAEAISRGTLYLKQCTQWLLDYAIVSAIDITVQVQATGALVFQIDLDRNGVPESHRFNVKWGA